MLTNISKNSMSAFIRYVEKSAIWVENKSNISLVQMALQLTSWPYSDRKFSVELTCFIRMTQKYFKKPNPRKYGLVAYNPYGSSITIFETILKFRCTYGLIFCSCFFFLHTHCCIMYYLKWRGGFRNKRELQLTTA